MSDKTCAKCGDAYDPAEAREYLGQMLCEDCYLDAMSPAKICDPWAVHTAKSLKDLPGGHALSPLQQQLYDLVKEKGEVPIPRTPPTWGSAMMSCGGNLRCCATWKCSGPARRTKVSS